AADGARLSQSYEQSPRLRESVAGLREDHPVSLVKLVLVFASQTLGKVRVRSGILGKPLTHPRVESRISSLSLRSALGCLCLHRFEKGVQLSLVLEVRRNRSIDGHQRQRWEALSNLLGCLASLPRGDDAVDAHAALADVPVAVALLYVFGHLHRAPPYEC